MEYINQPELEENNNEFIQCIYLMILINKNGKNK